MIQPEKQCAVIYDNSRDRVYELHAKIACRRARWIALPYEIPENALGELSSGANALIASISGDLSRDDFEGKELLLKSTELEIPRVIITANSTGSLWVRDEGPDLIVKKGRGAMTADVLMSWLVQVGEQQSRP